jgi:hypothetical protein
VVALIDLSNQVVVSVVVWEVSVVWEEEWVR